MTNKERVKEATRKIKGIPKFCFEDVWVLTSTETIGNICYAYMESFVNPNKQMKVTTTGLRMNHFKYFAILEGKIWGLEADSFGALRIA